MKLGCLLAAALVLATGCAATEPTPDAPHGIWLTPGTLGFAEQQAWGLPLPEGFGVVVLPPEMLAAQCTDDSPTLRGCTLGASVVLRNDLGAEWFHMVLLHEMGHVLEGNGGHIDDRQACPVDGRGGNLPGDFVMCPGGSAAGSAAQPEPEDFEFVLAGWLRHQGTYQSTKKHANEAGVSLEAWTRNSTYHG